MQFYTQIKTVAQQWKDLPTRRVSLPHPPTYETEMSSRGTSLARLPSSESDLPSREVSPAMPLASVKDLMRENLYLPLPPSEEDLPNSEVLPSTPPTREPELPRQEGSLTMPSTSERDSVNEKVLLSVPLAAEGDTESGSLSLQPASEGTYLPPTSQWGDSIPPISQRNMTIPSTAGRFYIAPDSQRLDKLAPEVQRTDAVEASNSERLYFPVSCSNDVAPMFLRNESVSPMTVKQDVQTTDMNTYPTSEAVYMPVISQRNEHAPTSQRTDTLVNLKPDKIYMASRRSDGMNLVSLMTDASIHPTSGGLYMSTSHRNAMPSASDKMCLPSEIQNEGYN